MGDEIDDRYRALVERVRGYPMTEPARARILAEVEEIYRSLLQRERGPGAARA